ncbi:MAG: flagellar basal body P-ring formation chaperone FlgA [Methyloligellaceae bacterium]
MTFLTPSEQRSPKSLLKPVQRLLLALAAVSIFVAQPVAAQQDEPVLRENIVVYSDVVTLGDLFENAATVANIPVFRSPDAGQDGIVTGHRIAAAAHQHGLIWANPGEIDKVAVSRPSRKITPEDLTKLVRGRIAQDLGIKNEGTLDIKLNARTATVHLDSRNTSPLTVQSLDLNNTSGVFRARIGYSGVSETQTNIVVRGRAIEMAELPVPVRPILRNQTIATEDIKVIRIAKARISDGTAQAREDVIGKAAKRRLTANRPMQRSDLEAPKVIKRNTMVEILFVQGGLLLKSEGRALSDAAKGQAVKVLNTQTKRTIEGTAVAAGVVSVAAKTRAAAFIKSRVPARQITRVETKKGERISPWTTRVVRANEGL